MVRAVGSSGPIRAHMLDMGITPGVMLTLEKRAPLGDPVELKVRGYSLSLRLAEAAGIEVEPAVEPPVSVIRQVDDFGYRLSMQESNSHPGFGEGGRYHNHEDEVNELPKGTLLTIALVGQQNSGKTAMFNVLTGSNQHVGNFPGVTVDRKDGGILGHPDTMLTDLPGICSLSAYTSEEVVTREFILRDRPTCLINVVDANNIERSLYLTVQLMELDIPVVLALNMMDEVRGNGGVVRINEMESILGIPVVPVSAMKNEGMDELVSHAMHVARYQETPARTDICGKDENGGAVHRCLHGIGHLIEDHAAKAGIPVRFAATKIAEGDQAIIEMLNLTEQEKEMVDAIVRRMEEERGMDRAAAIADMRFTFIEKLCARAVVKPAESRESRRSQRMDRVLTGRSTSLPIFIAVMVLTLWVSIDLVGAPLQNLLKESISGLGSLVGGLLERAGVNAAVRSLVCDGIFNGVGAVVSFVPVIIVLFFFLSLLEDSGYMARVAFVTDKILRHIGLSGRSIVPLLIGLGCSVPAIMASRTLPSSRDRRMTILLTPFMSCSAKIPVYAFLSASFFPGHGGLILACMYLVGIGLGILVALFMKNIANRSEAAPFVMELPNYRIPALKNVAQLLWDKARDFLERAFTVIFLATMIIWFFESFNFRFELVENGEGSMLAWIAGKIAHLFAPLGLGDWRVVVSLISGFLSKESVVSSMQVLGADAFISSAGAVSLLVFCLLYTPCVATISVVKKELGTGWALFMIAFQCLVAWIAALLAYNVAMLFLG